MLRYLLLTLAIMPVLSAQSQQKANVGYNKILESTSRSYFLKTTLYEHKITVYSTIQIDVDQSYKNNELNKKIEEDMKKQWQETIQEAYPGTTRLFTIITNDYFTTYSRRHSLDEFIQIRRTQIQNDLRKKKIVLTHCLSAISLPLKSGGCWMKKRAKWIECVLFRKQLMKHVHDTEMTWEMQPFWQAR